jgi:uncharacterized protein (DUF4213/DUF364 family)
MPSSALTDQPATTGLSGHIAIDQSFDGAGDLLERELAKLRAFGWTFGDEVGDISIIGGRELKHVSRDRPALKLCTSSAMVCQMDAIAPDDAFAILNALGGGKLEQELAASVSDDAIVDKVVIGLNWTMIRAGDLCGIARSPARGTEGARTIRPSEGFTGKKLSDLAKYLCSADALSRSLGLAAVNCYWNRVDPHPDLGDQLADKGGFATVTPPGDGLVIIGGFRDVQKRLTNAKIIEREPLPGDIPVEDAPKAFRSAKQLAITAQTLMNGSLEPILNASSMVPKRSLVGPSAPLCPAILKHGLDESCGLVVIDPEATEQFILESGTMIMLDHLTHSACVRTAATA